MNSVTTFASAARRLLGAGVVVLAAVPFYRFLPGRETGLAGAATAAHAEVVGALLWTGTLVVVLSAVLAGKLLSAERVTRGVDALRRVLEWPGDRNFAWIAASLAFLLSASFALFALDGRPAHLDAMSQLLHARFWADGRLAGPTDLDPAFWQVQNSIVTPRGWVSHYPPGHVLLLSIGLRIGAVWLVGPLLVAAIAYFSARIAMATLPASVALARAGALLVAVSAFLVCLGGSFMNHASTAAFLAAATWYALEARRRPMLAVAAGAAAGFAFAVRPLTALAIASAVFATVWLTREDRPASARRFAGALLGAAPFVAAVALYNTWFFGAPTRFGYDVTLGPDAGLGFGRDPWGNVYGPLEAIGYTSADVMTLGSALLETPVSAVLIVGLLLLLAQRLTQGERVLVAWALAPVAANFFYWHHGNVMGPRMLYEAAPAWILLASAAVGRAWQAWPAEWPASRLSFAPRSALAGGVALSLSLGLFWLGPQRAAAHAIPTGSVLSTSVPRVEAPALVFVHDAWTARIAMQLASAGMRLDSIETALRQNATCDVQRLVDAVVTGDGEARARALGALDMSPRTRDLPPAVEIAAGNRIRIRPGERLPLPCGLQAQSDRHGILDLAPLVWLGDLPGGAARGPLFVRDLGPDRNADLIGRNANRTPLALYVPGAGAEPVLTSYDEAMRTLWGADPNTALRPSARRLADR